MRSGGRYLYHLQDIAKIKAMSQPVNSLQQMLLEQMEGEATEFENANPDEAKLLQARAKELAS